MRYLIVSCAIVCFIFFIIADAEKYGKKKFRGCRTNLMYEFAGAGIPFYRIIRYQHLRAATGVV
jgi:hypothetical protein